MFHPASPFLILLTIHSASSYPALHCDILENSVRELDVSGDSAAVVSDEDLALYRIDDESCVLKRSVGISNESSVTAVEHISFPLHDVVCICFSKNCRLYIATKQEDWRVLSLTFGAVIEVLEALIALSTESVFIQLTDTDSAYTYSFPFNLDSKADAVVPFSTEVVEEHSQLLLSFSNGHFVYFLNTYRLNGDEGKDDLLTDKTSLRLERFCANDTTKELHSKIGIILPCGGGSRYCMEEFVSSTFNDGHLVLLQRRGDIVEAMSYSIEELDGYFDWTWNLCQNTTKEAASTCRRNDSSQPDHCNILALFGGSEFCYRFGTQSGFVRTKRFENCGIMEFKKENGEHPVDNRSSKLINLLPYRGGELLTRYDGQNVARIEYTEGSLILVEDQALSRIPPDPHRVHNSSNNFKIGMLSNKKLVGVSDGLAWFVDKENNLRMTRLACDVFFPTCMDLEKNNFSDPLQCQFCQDTMTVISHLEQCDVRYNDTCSADKESVVPLIDKQQPAEMTNYLLIASAVLLTLLLSAASLVIFTLRKRKKSQMESAANTSMALNRIRRAPEYERLFDQLPLIESSRLTVHEICGDGHFGDVYRGILRTGEEEEIVACKLNRQSRELEFINEGLIMIDLSHEHILKLIGYSFNASKQPILITEFMPNKDLLKFIRNENNLVTFRQILTFGKEVAEGLSYLHHNQYIHRDIAARNCLLDAEYVVKIGDFGMCRRTSNEEYLVTEERQLPWRWLALEVLLYNKFTHGSDVWSFGVLLWELLHRGATPYEDRNPEEQRYFLLSGMRLGPPTALSGEHLNRIWPVVVDCFAVEERRPSIHEVLKHCQRALEDGDSEMDAEYRRVTPSDYIRVSKEADIEEVVE